MFNLWYNGDNMASDDTFTAEVPTVLEEHENFDKWENNVDGTQFTKIEATREKIENEGLITNAKNLKDGLYEKKWRSGLRLYFAVVEKEDGNKTLLLLGSGKDKEQNRAIMKSREALKKYKVIKEDIKFNPDKK
jgi:putative component of toxin-antitoxin plasmid stabilization module